MTPTALSVKKIKTFRLQPRNASVLKNLRALLEHPQITPELEKAVEAEVRAAPGILRTAALYATLPAGDAPAWVDPFLRPAGEPGAVAVTVFAATVGDGLEAEIAQALSRGETLRGRILTALGEELADQAGHFVARLVAEEAKADACELSDPRPLTDAALRQSLLGFLDAARIPLSLGADGSLAPRLSRLGYILWRPPAKKRK